MQLPDNGANTAVFPIEFSLTAADGTPHKYTAHTHRPREGFALGARWLSGVMRPIAALLNVELSDFEGLDSFSASVSISTGAGAATLAEILTAEDTFDVIQATLGLAFRDGLPLKVPGNFDVAYQANYDEMVDAAWRVAASNGFFGRLSGLLARLKTVGMSALSEAGSSDVASKRSSAPAS